MSEENDPEAGPHPDVDPEDGRPAPDGPIDASYPDDLAPAPAPAKGGDAAAFTITLRAPDGAEVRHQRVGRYLLVAFGAADGRLEVLDTNMDLAAVDMAARIAVEAVVGPVVMNTLADYARRQERKRPGIVTARGVPPEPNAGRRNGRILPPG